MHLESLVAMTQLVERAPRSTVHVLDVGSMDINGTFKPLIMSKGWKYIGLDLEPGPNVDVVPPGPYDYGFLDDSFDLVISGSAMEHVELPWLWLPELVRVLRPGGLLCIVTHWSFYVHRHPVDCWRVLPDGMKALFNWEGNLERYDIRIINDHDIAASAFKKEKVRENTIHKLN
jgi:SAM-dependent methyltransferase